MIDIHPVEILVWWIGPTVMPQWRRDNVVKLASFYPDAKLVEYYDHCESDSERFADRHVESDDARLKFVSSGQRRLWVDNDIEVIKQFRLTETPAVALENFPHWSILWSGDNPDIFKQLKSIYSIGKDFIREKSLGNVDFITEDYFIHWKSDGTVRKGNNDLLKKQKPKGVNNGHFYA